MSLARATAQFRLKGNAHPFLAVLSPHLPHFDIVARRPSRKSGASTRRFLTHDLSKMQPEKTQPWKANWPPKTTVSEGESHGFEAGEILQLEGSAGVHPPPQSTQ